MSFGVRNPYLEYSDWGWALDPKGLRYYLEMIYDRYEKTINGCRKWFRCL